MSPARRVPRIAAVILTGALLGACSDDSPTGIAENGDLPAPRASASVAAPSGSVLVVNDGSGQPVALHLAYNVIETDDTYITVEPEFRAGVEQAFRDINRVDAFYDEFTAFEIPPLEDEECEEMDPSLCWEHDQSLPGGPMPVSDARAAKRQPPMAATYTRFNGTDLESTSSSSIPGNCREFAKALYEAMPAYRAAAKLYAYELIQLKGYATVAGGSLSKDIYTHTLTLGKLLDVAELFSRGAGVQLTLYEIAWLKMKEQESNVSYIAGMFVAYDCFNSNNYGSGSGGGGGDGGGGTGGGSGSGDGGVGTLRTICDRIVTKNAEGQILYVTTVSCRTEYVAAQ